MWYRQPRRVPSTCSQESVRSASPESARSASPSAFTTTFLSMVHKPSRMNCMLGLKRIPVGSEGSGGIGRRIWRDRKRMRMGSGETRPAGHIHRPARHNQFLGRSEIERQIHFGTAALSGGLRSAMRVTDVRPAAFDGSARSPMLDHGGPHQRTLHAR